MAIFSDLACEVLRLVVYCTVDFEAVDFVDPSVK